MNRFKALREHPILATAAWALVFWWVTGSWGFSPTDDGYFLAIGRRLLDGEIPHLDFISQRPALTALVHSVALLGGDHTFLLSRLVVSFEWSCLALFWTQLWAQALRIEKWFPQVGLFVLVFVLNSHHFPLMAWPTVDGLFFSSFGLWVWARSPAKTSSLTFVAFLLMGLAPLTRQNFLLAPLVLLFLLRPERKAAALLGAGLPCLAYGFSMGLLGAWKAMIEQIFVHTGSLLDLGFRDYFRHVSLLGITGVFLFSAICRLPRRADLWLRLMALAVLIVSLPFPYRFLDEFSFAAPALAVWTWFRLSSEWRAGTGRWLGAALVLGWSAAISLGYHSWALASGPLIGFSWMVAWRDGKQMQDRGAQLVVGLLVLATVVSGARLRAWEIYRDRPVPELTQSLTGILPGGAGLLTNLRTAEWLTELHDLEAWARDEWPGRSIAILPDAAAFWVGNKQRNPLPNDWPQHNEVSSPSAEGKMEEAITSLSPQAVFLIAKTRPFGDFAVYDESVLRSRYPFVLELRARLQRQRETRDFEVYQGLKEDAAPSSRPAARKGGVR